MTATTFRPHPWMTGPVTAHASSRYAAAADKLPPDASEVADISIGLNDIVSVTLTAGDGSSFEAQVLRVRGDGQLMVQAVEDGKHIGYKQWIWEYECVVLVKAAALEVETASAR